MTWLKNKINRKECVMIGVFIVLLALLWWIPTGFQKQIYVNSEGVKAKVVEVNNKGVYSTGMIQQGDQRCTIEILEGELVDIYFNNGICLTIFVPSFCTSSTGSIFQNTTISDFSPLRM